MSHHLPPHELLYFSVSKMITLSKNVRPKIGGLLNVGLEKQGWSYTGGHLTYGKIQHSVSLGEEARLKGAY